MWRGTANAGVGCRVLGRAGHPSEDWGTLFGQRSTPRCDCCGAGWGAKPWGKGHFLEGAGIGLLLRCCCLEGAQPDPSLKGEEGRGSTTVAPRSPSTPLLKPLLAETSRAPSPHLSIIISPSRCYLAIICLLSSRCSLSPLTFPRNPACFSHSLSQRQRRLPAPRLSTCDLPVSYLPPGVLIQPPSQSQTDSWQRASAAVRAKVGVREAGRARALPLHPCLGQFSQVAPIPTYSPPLSITFGLLLLIQAKVSRRQLFPNGEMLQATY